MAADEEKKPSFSSISSLLKNVAEESRAKKVSGPEPPTSSPEPFDQTELPSLLELPGPGELSSPATAATAAAVAAEPAPSPWSRVLRVGGIVGLTVVMAAAGLWLLLQPVSIETRLREAAKLIAAGKDLEAERVFAECRKENPLDPKLPATFGTAYFARREYEKADSYARQALTLEFNHREALGLLVELGLATENLATAGEGSSQLKKFYPNEVAGYLAQARVELARGNPNEALAELVRAEWISKDDPGLYRLRRRAYYRLGDYDAALQANEVLVSAGREAEVEEDFIDLVRVLLARDNHYLAAEYLRQGREKFPDSTELLRLDIETARREKRYAQMEESARRLIELQPQAAEGYFYAGEAAYARRNLPGAIGWYQQAAGLDPRYAPALQRLGDLALFEFSQPETALTWYDRAAAGGTPPTAELVFNRGQALFALARYDEAAGAFARVRELKPASRPAAYNLGTAELVRGAATAAITAYEACEGWVPMRGRRENNLGVAAELTGDTPAALRWYFAARELDVADAGLTLAPTDGNFARIFAGGRLTDPAAAMVPDLARSLE